MTLDRKKLISAEYDLESLLEVQQYEGLLAVPVDSWPASSRGRVAMLVPIVLFAVERAHAAAGAEDRATVERIGSAVAAWWAALADRLGVPVEVPRSPCAGPECRSKSAPLACVRCRVSVYCGRACQRARLELEGSADLDQGRRGRSTSSSATSCAAATLPELLTALTRPLSSPPRPRAPIICPRPHRSAL